MEALNLTPLPFFDWLLETTVVASILVCLILAAQRLLGHRLGPRWCHALWLILLVRMILPWTPSVSVDIGRLLPDFDRSLPSNRSVEVQGPTRTGPAFDLTSSQSTEAPSAGPIRIATEPTQAEPPGPSPRPIPSEPLWPPIRRVLPLVWLVGAIVLGTWLLASNFALWRIVKREHPLVKEPILELFEQCKTQMGVDTIVALVPTDRIRTAALFGFIRPRLLLPRDMVETARHEELRYIFLHELGHLRRRDIYIGWLASLLQVLHWFNPLVWLAFYRMRNDRELACDALVLTRTERRESHQYGQTMVALLGRFSRTRPLPAMAGILESQSQMKRRITMIAKFDTTRYRWSPTAIIVFLILAAVSLINAAQPGISPESTADQTDLSLSQNLITDPNTGLQFRKVRGITGSKDVIDMTYHGTHLNISPNGRFLLYMDWIIPLGDGDARKLTNGDLRVGRVRWSPDGTMIAFYSDGGIWVRPISQQTGEPTGPAKKLVDGEYWYQFSVQWSPDSEKVVYEARDGHLYVVTVSDGTTRQLTSGPVGRRRMPGGWSPDGKWISYNQNSDSIWSVPSDGGPSRKLMDVEGRGIPHWTPDGRWILCQWNDDLRFTRFSDGMTVDLTVPKEVGAFFSWSPDNKKMLFYKPSYAWRDSLRVISVSGGQPIAPDAWSAGQPMWTPDGRFIFTWGEYQDRYLFWVTPFGSGAAEPYPLLLDRPYGYLPGLIASGQAFLSPSKDKLFFGAHTDSGQPEYWVVPISAAKATSTGPAVKVFDKGPFERDACWSPDESKIAIMCEGDLWIVHTDGSPPVKFTAAADRKVVHRAWSPDGSAISLVSHDPNSGQSALRVRSLSGDPSREIVRTQKFIRHSWSPDGTWIAYELYENESDTTRELFVARASGGEFRRLIEAPYDYHAAFDFAWHPQGDQLAMLCDRRLLLLDPVSGQAQEISTLPDPIWGRPYHMQWSPDGKMLGLVLEAKPNSTRDRKDVSGDTRLFTVTVPEGQWTELAGEAGTNYYFVWSPDGKWVAYNSEGWIRKRPEGVLWEVDVDPFLRRATGEDLASKTHADGAGPTLRRIETRGPGRVHSRPSYDGRYMSYVDRETEDLAVRDIATDERWNLTNAEPDSGNFAYWSSISPDNTQVIYYWFNVEKEDFDLRIVNLDGSDDRLLWGAEEGAAWFNVDAWSPDGKYVYGELLGEDEPARLVRLRVADGSRQIIKEFDGTRFFTMSCSPNGRYLAYDRAESEDSARDIFVYDLEANQEWPLIAHSANDKLLGWTPRGNHIFFASDRNGTWDGWLLPIRNGARDGVPEMIKAGMGDIVPIRFTKDGAFYYAYEHSGWNVYTGLLDEDHTKLTKRPEPVRHLGKDAVPDWSPNGQYLAYFSQPDRDKPPTIRIRTLATDQEREITPDLPHCQWLRWCPDSRHLLLTDVAGQSIIYKLDVLSGEHQMLLRKDIEKVRDRIRQAELSDDGKTLAYRIRGTGNLNRLVVRDLETGREKELLRTEAMSTTGLVFAGGWALSPDGNEVALCIREGDGDSPFALQIMSVESSECRTVVKGGAWQVDWTTDNGDLLVTRNQNELWMVSAQTGEARKLLEWNGLVLCPRLHPDGRRLAFCSGGRVSEMWVMEDFLPEAVARGLP